MGYDRGDSFPFDFEPNGFPFGSKSNGKLSLRSYPIQCERNYKYSFLSVTYTLTRILPNIGKIPFLSVRMHHNLNKSNRYQKNVGSKIPYIGVCSTKIGEISSKKSNFFKMRKSPINL